MTPDSTFKLSDIRAFVRNVLVAWKTPDDVAEVVSASITQAEGKGVLSHGLMRLPQYLDLIAKGMLDVKARPEIRRAGVASLSCDGHHGFGMFTGYEIARAASQVSSKTGICLAVCTNINHLGMLEYFTETSAGEGFISIAMTNAHPTVAHPMGRSPVIGTNPVSISIPAVRSPFNLDMAISRSSFGTIREAALEGKRIPEGIAMDAEGNITTDPVAALSGALLPFGGIKGFALGMVVDMLAGVLSGSAAGRAVVTWNDEGRMWNSGLFFISIDPSFLMPQEKFRGNIDRYLDTIRSYSYSQRVPGDMRRKKLQEAETRGIRIKPKTLQSLLNMARESGVAFPVSTIP